MSNTTSELPAQKQAPRNFAAITRNPTIIAALVSGMFGLAAAGLSFILIERSRTELQRQSTELERMKNEMAAQALNLERSRVEIALSAQRTSELVAQIDDQRLRLEWQVAQSTAESEERRLQIDASRSRTDELRITPDFTKLLNDLRPNLDFTCSADDARWPKVRLICKTKNIGQHKVHLKPEGLSVLDFSTRAPILGGVTVVELPGENSVSVGIEGESLLDAEIAPEIASRRQVIFVAVFSSRTDDLALKVATRLVKGVLTDKEISDAAVQRNTYTLRFSR